MNRRAARRSKREANRFIRELGEGAVEQPTFDAKVANFCMLCIGIFALAWAYVVLDARNDPMREAYIADDTRVPLAREYRAER